MKPLMLPPVEQRYFDPVETLPRPDLLALQQQRFLAMVAYTYEHSAFVCQLRRVNGHRQVEHAQLALVTNAGSGAQHLELMILARD
jgi:phenylacetate-coenzyme A ligase PaaK-like adenylate-forming protein